MSHGCLMLMMIICSSKTQKFFGQLIKIICSNCIKKSWMEIIKRIKKNKWNLSDACRSWGSSAS